MSLKGKPYYNQLKDEIDTILKVSPYLDEVSVYNFLRGKKSDDFARQERLKTMCEGFGTKPDEVMEVIRELEKPNKKITNSKLDTFGFPDDAA